VERFMTKVLSLVLLSAAALVAGGCADTYGVDIANKTGQPLNVTYLEVASDGSTRPYAQTTLAKGGLFTNQMTRDQYGYGKRVRFSIPERSPDDPTSNLELKLSDERVRNYDLMVVNGRLVARELTRARPENRPLESQ
jgi:hypothetical protein